MTKDEINKIIHVFESIKEYKIKPPHETAIIWEKTKEALTEYRDSLDRFDVLQHLREGGKIERDNEPGIYYTWHAKDANFLRPSTDKVSSKFVHCLITFDDWQPYQPPVEDMLEDGCVYWVKDTVTGVIQDTPYKWIDKHFIFPDGDGGYFDWPIDLFEPILRDGKPIKAEMPE